MEIQYYVTANGRNLIEEWLDSLRDDVADAKITARITRLQSGNFGDCKFLQEGVWELRIDTGPGYRIYYAKAGSDSVLLLCGGDKRKQSKDIKRAIQYWKDYQERAERQ
jgi:putative addiction module killer protein